MATLQDFIDSASSGFLTVAQTRNTDRIEWLAGGTLAAYAQAEAATARSLAEGAVTASSVNTVAISNIPSLAYQPLGKDEAHVLQEWLNNGYSKTPIIDWLLKRALWLGTSIPHQGAGVDSYPELVGKRLRMALVDNEAWSGSHAFYAGFDTYNSIVGDDAEDLKRKRINHIVSLSMTQADVNAANAALGPGTAYQDGWDQINYASQMTADFRIKQRFQQTPFEVVFLDHNHNDMYAPVGDLNPASLVVTGVTLGGPSVVTLESLGDLAVGDGLCLRINGIPKMQYAAGRVQAIDVATKKVTVAFNSTGFTGTFTTGVAERADRRTLNGAMQFLIHYIYNSALLVGAPLPTIILSSAPSEYTGGAFTSAIYRNARNLQKLADKWKLAMFDAATKLGVTKLFNDVLLGDKVHPTTLEQRKLFADFWAEWLRGGAVPVVHDGDYLARGAGDLINNRELEYTKYTGVGTPDFVVTGSTPVLTEGWASTAGWTPLGSPTTVTAPWNGSLRALQATSVSNSLEALIKTVPASSAVKLSFSFMAPVVAGLVPAETVGQVTLFRIEADNGAWFAVSLVVTQTGCKLSLDTFAQPSAGGYKQYEMSLPPITAGSVYNLEIDAIKQTSTRRGAIYATVNGVEALGGPKYIGDLAMTGATKVVAGISLNNVGNFTCYVGPVLYSSLTTPDYSTRYTGTIAPGQTATVVNGKITSVA